MWRDVKKEKFTNQFVTSKLTTIIMEDLSQMTLHLWRQVIFTCDAGAARRMLENGSSTLPRHPFTEPVDFFASIYYLYLLYFNACLFCAAKFLLKKWNWYKLVKPHWNTNINNACLDRYESFHKFYSRCNKFLL